MLTAPLHRTGAPFKVAVSKATKEAAERVRAAAASRSRSSTPSLRKAAKETGASVLPGRFRRTIARYAVEQGATIEELAAYHRHEVRRTTWSYAQPGA